MHVAITGASSGIGEALARAYAQRGAALTLIARRHEKLVQLAAQLPGKPCICAHDLGVSARATDWIAAAQSAHGPIDVLINNAGTTLIGSAATTDEAAFDAVVQLNLLSPVRLIRALIPGMIERGNGLVVNVTSVAAFLAPPMQTSYASTKAALSTFSEALRWEVANSGVKVLTVYPGPVRTALADVAYAAYGGRHGAIALLPEGRAPRLAELILQAAEQGKPRLIYPSAYKSVRWAPWLVQWATRFTPLPQLAAARASADAT
jgi:short-subunit dehydrogenase